MGVVVLANANAFLAAKEKCALRAMRTLIVDIVVTTSSSSSPPAGFALQF